MCEMWVVKELLFSREYQDEGHALGLVARAMCD